MTFTQTIADRYGVDETNGLIDGAAYHSSVDHSRSMTLGQLAKAGGRVTRLRILTDVRPGTGRVYDFSYCHGTLQDGTIVEVRCGRYGSGILRKIKSDLIEWAQEEKVYAKAVGLLDENNWSILY